MRKRDCLFFLVCIIFLIVSCRSEVPESYVLTKENDTIQAVYYTKNKNEEFLNFLNNPEKIRKNYRSAVEKEKNTELTENEMFALLWEALSEKEKNNVMENIDKVEITIESSLGVPKDSTMGRAILDNTESLDSICAVYRFTEILKEEFKDITVPASIVKSSVITFPNEYRNEIIPVSNVIEILIKNEEWECVETILTYLKSPISIQELKKYYNEYKKEVEKNDSNSQQRSMTFGANFPLVNDFGKTMSDGTVILESGLKKAFVVAGTYAHAGIFSTDKFNNNGGKDTAHCIYTAQPAISKLKDYASNAIPDRPGFACLDTVTMYTQQKRMATILPKNYTEEKGKLAASYAKTIFYDQCPSYFLPIWELLYLGDTSHDGTSSYTYCSKVPYTAWRMVGVNLDSNCFAGNLVAPDDLYGAVFSHYKVLTIWILWWHFDICLNMYTATADLITQVEQ